MIPKDERSSSQFIKGTLHPEVTLKVLPAQTPVPLPYTIDV
jgi:hypothetical protein